LLRNAVKLHAKWRRVALYCFAGSHSAERRMSRRVWRTATRSRLQVAIQQITNLRYASAAGARATVLRSATIARNADAVLCFAGIRHDFVRSGRFASGAVNMPSRPGPSSQRWNRSSSTDTQSGSATRSSASGRIGGRRRCRWMATGMPGACYEPGNRHYAHHLANYGHPSTNGYKDIIPLWKAEKWDPDRLMALYQKAGARYFVSMAVTTTTLICGIPAPQWNAVNLGPKRDVVAIGRRRRGNTGCASASRSTWGRASLGSKPATARTRPVRWPACL